MSQSLQVLQTPRMAAAEPCSILLLLSVLQTLTQTETQRLAGECGSERKQPPPGGARGRRAWVVSWSLLLFTILPNPPAPISIPRSEHFVLFPSRPARLTEVLGGGSGSHRLPPTGSHSLRYLVTTTASRSGLRDFHVFIVASVDHVPFMRFDSDADTQRIQARGPWVKQMGPEYLEMEKRNMERYSHRARENLRFAIQVYNQSDNGE